MATYTPPKRATEYVIYVGLEDSANAGLFKANPTLVTTDVQVSKDGGALANIEGGGTFADFVSVTPAAGKMVKLTLNSAHMTADNVTVVFSDAAGGEWNDLIINIPTAANQFDDLPTNAEVATEISDALATDTYAELAAVPAATSTLADKINWLFALARNKMTQTATTQTLRNDADGADVATSATSDSAGTFTRGEWS